MADVSFSFFLFSFHEFVAVLLNSPCSAASTLEDLYNGEKLCVLGANCWGITQPFSYK